MRKRSTKPPEAPEAAAENQGTQLTNNAPATDTDAAAKEQAGTRARSRPRRSPKTSGKAGTNKGKSAGTHTETGRLIEALLVSRGQRGASEAELERVLRWAQGIRAEASAIEAAAAELRKLGPRGSRNAGGAAATRHKQQRQERQRELEERRLRHGLDQALLGGVLAGDIVLDVRGQGELLFRHEEPMDDPVRPQEPLRLVR